MTTSDASSSRPDVGTATGNGNNGGQPGNGTDNQGMVDQIKETGNQVLDQAGETAGHLLDQAKGQVTPQLEDQREKVAGTIGQTASALRKAGEQLHGQDQEFVAQYIDRAASQVEGFSRYLRERQLADLFGDTERFARRQPGLFLTGAFGLGLLAARFLKSSNPHPQQRFRSGASGTSGSGAGTPWRAGETGYGNGSGTYSNGSTTPAEPASGVGER